MNRYPDMGNTALYAALAERLGVPPARLAAGTGSVAVLYHLLQAFCETGDEVVYAWRSFEAYPIAVAVAGADVGAGAASPPTAGTTSTPWRPRSPTGPAWSSSARPTTRPGPSVDRRPSSRRSSTRVPDARAGGGRRGLPRVRARRATRSTGSRRYRGHPNVVVHAHVRQGLRAGRVPGRVRRRATERSPRPCARCALPFGVSSRRPGGRGRLPGARGRAARAGRARSSPSATRVRGARCASQGWTVPDAQGNFVWLPLGERTGRLRGGRARRRGRWSARSPATARGSRIGEPAGNDRVARGGRHVRADFARHSPENRLGRSGTAGKLVLTLQPTHGGRPVLRRTPEGPPSPDAVAAASAVRRAPRPHPPAGVHSLWRLRGYLRPYVAGAGRHAGRRARRRRR